ncbi:flavin reductase [Bradyrhizobium sp. 192]|uniref:flavin reductase n=1 Tax=Bradyrhizobium sp. 192 TaxID=2782660 RepID=UPI001FFEC25B|nr:flavin reductase [Bradyrhizobium sp. 192]
MAWFGCEVTRHVDVGDHTPIIAEVSSCDHRDTRPLVLISSRYHRGRERRWRGEARVMPHAYATQPRKAKPV